MIGTVVFAFISGSITSVLQSTDSSSASTEEHLLYLNKMKMQYNLSSPLYNEIKRSFSYEGGGGNVGLDGFIGELPPHLQMAIQMTIHKKTFETHPLFKTINNKRLLAFISSRLTPLFAFAGTIMYTQGDTNNGLLIISSGKAAMVKPRYHNAIFYVIDPKPKDTGMQTLASIGLEDNIINHLLLIKDMKENKYDDMDLDRRMNQNQLAKRYFSVQSI